MRVVVRLEQVNQRRYGPAWIALVTDWPSGKAPALKFGRRVTYDVAEIDAPVGALVKYGRKDHRGRGTQNDFARVLDSGQFMPMSAEVAREYFLDREGTAP